MKQWTIAAIALALVLGTGGVEPETKGAMALDGILVVRTSKPASQPEAQQQKPAAPSKQEPARTQTTRSHAAAQAKAKR
jgi:hypothetical protein